MKKIVLHIVAFAALGLCLLASCSSNEWPTFNMADSYVAFQDTTYVTYEDRVAELKIPVGLSGESGRAVTVGFEFTVATGSTYRTAVEGVDYQLLNSSKELHYANGVGYDTIRIKSINNTIKDGHSAFRIKLTTSLPSHNIGFSGKRTYADVLIYDDESMSPFEGKWLVSGKTISINLANNQVTGDTAANNTLAFRPYVVTIVSHPTEQNTLLVQNLYGYGQNVNLFQVNMVVDTVARTVSLKHGKIGVFQGHDINLYTFDDDVDVKENADIPGSLQLGANGYVDRNVMKVWQYAAILFADGIPYGLDPASSVLKSTWTRVKE